MDKTANETSNRTGGAKRRDRKKMLISMTAAEYAEFDAWAEADGTTKAMLMHDMMGRERARRAGLHPVGTVDSSAANCKKAPRT